MDNLKEYKDTVYSEVARLLNFTIKEAFEFGYSNNIDYMISVIGPYDNEIKQYFESDMDIEDAVDKVMYEYTWFGKD